MERKSHKPLSVVCWGKPREKGDIWLMNTPYYSYLYTNEDVEYLTDVLTRNQGLWQLKLILDMSKMAARYIGCSFAYRPGSTLINIDDMLMGDMPPLAFGHFRRIGPPKLAITVDYAVVWVMWKELTAPRTRIEPVPPNGGPDGNP